MRIVINYYSGNVLHLHLFLRFQIMHWLLKILVSAERFCYTIKRDGQNGVRTWWVAQCISKYWSLLSLYRFTIPIIFGWFSFWLDRTLDLNNGNVPILIGWRGFIIAKLLILKADHTFFLNFLIRRGAPFFLYLEGSLARFDKQNPPYFFLLNFDDFLFFLDALFKHRRLPHAFGRCLFHWFLRQCFLRCRPLYIKFHLPFFVLQLVQEVIIGKWRDQSLIIIFNEVIEFTPWSCR
jgi:hypothetical protein